MRANKIFFDLFSTSGGTLPYEEYREWYNKHDTVYIALLDAGIYTKVKRQEMFDKGMNLGCFIKHCPMSTPEKVTYAAMKIAEEHNLLFVTPDEFIQIEKSNENHRVAKAFATAERMIKEG